MGGPRALICENGRFYLVKDTSKDYHTAYGYLKKSDLQKKSGVIKSNTGKNFHIFEPSFTDYYNKIKRGPQVIPRKDIGIIIAETAINKDAVVVDAGTGSGALSFFLANTVKQVTSYELRNDFFQIAKKNADFLGLKNLIIKNKDITDGIEEKNLDLVTLDLPEPWLVVSNAEKALKHGAFLVSYSPTTPQISDFIAEVKKNKNLQYIKTLEVSAREWEFDARKVRPKFTPISHSGFLCFVRKL